MPTATLSSIAKKAGVSLKQAEKVWEKAKSLAKEQGNDPEDENFYAAVVGILKKILKVETVDLLRVGWNPEVLAEAVISKSSASFMKSRIRKIADSIGNLGSGEPVNWKSVALHLRLFFDEYLGALSSRTGLKALLLGESVVGVPEAYRKINLSGDKDELIEEYIRIFPDVDRFILDEVVSGY